MSHQVKIVRPSWDEYFLLIAKTVALRSHDAETHVGAVIVDDNHRILSTGYNGFPPGCDDSGLPNIRPYKYPYMIHAEMNAIASSRQDLRNSTLYTTHSPCGECAKAIITAGIKHVVYEIAYLNDNFDFVQNFLTSCGITCTQKAAETKIEYFPTQAVEQ
jgi:dCMP deaminase